MAEANRKTTYDSPANREDLADIVYNVDPWEAPFYTRIPVTRATAVKHEWPIDELEAVDANNAAVEGDDATIQASTNPQRRDNNTQIFTKTLMVSGTQQSVIQAGVDDEVDYQLVKKTKAMRRDIETAMLSNVVKNAGNKTTARRLAGYQTWCITNYSGGATGVGPTGGDGSTAATNGTARAFTEDLLLANLQSCWSNGGNIDMLIVGAFNKGVVSGFSGYATRMKTAEDRRLVQAIDIYDSDFHETEIVPDRFSDAAVAYTVQTDMWASAELRPMFSEELARVGDAERWQIIAELTLEARNEKASGQIRDLTTS